MPASILLQRCTSRRAGLDSDNEPRAQLCADYLPAKSAVLLDSQGVSGACRIGAIDTARTVPETREMENQLNTSGTGSKFKL